MRLLRGEKNREVRYAVNTIGAALYHLREHIKKLEMAHGQQVESEVEESKETTGFADTLPDLFFYFYHSISFYGYEFTYVF